MNLTCNFASDFLGLDAKFWMYIKSISIYTALTIFYYHCCPFWCTRQGLILFEWPLLFPPYIYRGGSQFSLLSLFTSSRSNFNKSFNCFTCLHTSHLYSSTATNAW
ncbi:hypothetical protein BT96DRAFT_1024796 [Gymnopus androsaceus JB14]|uniref:Uncharacterized protein n=1 Tax=Gymnopus androsaceus JB14 TaxID=1447944 RepID=A0A6A4GW11_9AGAR|nr:hypothetical protein BT96DRAFT_1024796 [Gymnopus androsaceus JB14]